MDEICFLKKLTHTSVFLLAESGAVLNPLTPAEEELLTFYRSEYPHEQNIRYFTENHNPAIQQDSLLFFWIAAPEYRGQTVGRLYIAGPFTDTVRTDNRFLAKNISPALSKYFTGLPSIAYHQIYRLADSLYQTLNQKSAMVVSVYPDNAPDALRSNYT